MPRKETSYIVVHCAATKPDQDIGAREIDAWHRKNGWIGCGYHYVIRRDGTIERGRAEHAVGAHAEQVNQISVGVCLVGGLDASGKPAPDFAQPQWSSLRRLLADLCTRYPKASVVGHRDIPGVAKACPSFDVKAWCSDGLILP